MKVVTLILTIFVALTKQQQQQLTDDDWWHGANIYQIAPVSFKDSNGDGKGDVQGIISKLDYFVDTGIDVLLLSPFFQSPMFDFAYDISNYIQVDTSFGTMSDVEELFAKAKEKGIRIILDFVPSHTSHRHEWFIKSEVGERGYEDFYVWHDGIPQINDGRPLQPNYWVSEYGGFSWKWSGIREAYYYHKFAEQQPTLNLREDRVIQELNKVLKFWMDKGADGFRIDSVSHLIEDSAFLDTPDVAKDLPQTYELIEKWRELIDNYTAGGQSKILIPQVWNSPINDLMRYYQSDDGSKQRAQVPMNFILINELNQTSNAKDFQRVIDSYLKALPPNAIANWFFGTHDHNRVASRMGKERIDGLMMLLLTLPGISFTYYGDEIGMLDNDEISWDDTLDPQACNTNPAVYQYVSRDVARSPFQWDATKNSGFTTGDSTYIPVYSKYVDNNLEQQMSAEWSHYKLYKNLLALRKNDTFVKGDFDLKALNENVLSFSRTYRNESFVVAINLGASNEDVDLSVFANKLEDECEIHLTSTQSSHKIGDVVNLKNVKLQAYDAVVVKYSSATRTTLSLLAIVLVLVKLFM